MPTPYEQTGLIPGGLPALGAAAPIGGSPGALQAGYMGAYNTALGVNTANYQNILAGYQQTAAGQRTAQDALAAGYTGLAGRIGGGLAAAGQDERATAGWYGGTLGEMYGRQADIDARYGTLGADVQGRLDPMAAAGGRYAGANAGLAGGYGGLTASVLGDVAQLGGTERRDIAQRYGQMAANADQSAISRGLANTTVRDTLQRGIAYDQSRANLDLTERLAGVRAQYGTQLGLAGLGFGERAAQGELGQANQEAQLRAGYAANLGQQALGFRERAGANQVAQANLQTGAFLGQRGDEARAQAAYGTQIGLGGLNQGARNIEANTALAGRQLGFMESVNAPYPNAGLYAQLAQQAGYGAGRTSPADLPPSQVGGGLQRVAGSGGQVPGVAQSSFAPPQLPPGFGQASPFAGPIGAVGLGYTGGGYGAYGGTAVGFDVPEASQPPGYYGYNPDEQPNDPYAALVGGAAGYGQGSQGFDVPEAAAGQGYYGYGQVGLGDLAGADFLDYSTPGY